MKKSKGSSYERDICKLLSKWFANNESRDDIFWRTSGSGGRATVRMKKCFATANSCGDICALDKIGDPLIEICTFELKRGYSGKNNEPVSLLNLIDGKFKEPILIKWINKAIKEAKEHGRRHVVIIFKRDRKTSCVLFLQDTFTMLSLNMAKNYNKNCAILYIDNLQFIVTRLDDFLKWCSPKAFFGEVKLKRKIRFKIPRNV